MRIATRTFLWTFVPVVFLFVASFWVVERFTVSSVRGELRRSLRLSEIANARLRAKSELRKSRVLNIIADNAPLKAGLQLASQNANDDQARRTLEEQLTDICENLGFDFLHASNSDGIALSGVVRNAEKLESIDLAAVQPPRAGFYMFRGVMYQISAVPVTQAGEEIGLLRVGEKLDLSDFTTEAVLTRNGRVLKSSLPGIAASQLEDALRGCDDRSECDLRVAGQTYISLPIVRKDFAGGYALRSLQNVEAASGSIQKTIRGVFGASAVVGTFAVLLLSLASSRSIVRPIGFLVCRLRDSLSTGSLPRFESFETSIPEIRELMESFNRSADAIERGEQQLSQAYVEFVESLASALDARDPYTAGHSRRVSQGCCAVGRLLGLPEADLQDLRIGALLHDIGKIGIADSVLQKAGKLTDQEFALIKQHPVIGRRILEGVRRFHVYLSVVELHHENWDGTGYPHGLEGESVPIGARVVHVVDAYDAMTSDRPYRAGLEPQEALRILRRFAGSQFDPKVVEVFCSVSTHVDHGQAPGTAESSLGRLLEAVRHENAEVSSASRSMQR